MTFIDVFMERTILHFHWYYEFLFPLAPVSNIYNFFSLIRPFEGDDYTFPSLGEMLNPLFDP